MGWNSLAKMVSLFFTRLFRGGESGAYKIKPDLFLFAFGLLASTKILFERNKEIFFPATRFFYFLWYQIRLKKFQITVKSYKMNDFFLLGREKI